MLIQNNKTPVAAQISYFVLSCLLYSIVLTNALADQPVENFPENTEQLQSENSDPMGEWSLDFNFQQYFLPDESDIGTPVVSLYYNNFLLEGRYNYEARDSGSVWLGRAFSYEQIVELEIIPMLGVVFGSSKGVAPGLKFDASWKFLNLYSEAEYVFDTESQHDNFFYSWSELTVGLLDWLRVGIVGTRTRLYDTSVVLDRGPLVKVELEPVTLSGTVLNIDSDEVFILGAELSF